MITKEMTAKRMLQNQISFFSVQVIGQIKSVENNERPTLMFL